MANARLSAQASLAEDYFLLRDLDEQARLYRQTISGFETFLQLTTFQFKEGTQALSAVVSAQSQLYAAQALLISVGSARAQMEHAIAVLTGAPPATLTIAPASLSRDVPVAPAGVPSTLLQRRPDIAAAERQVSSANAQIGVAIAAYYPDLTLSAGYGASSGDLAGLVSAGTSLWSVGADLSTTLLDFGQRRAQVAAARALYDEDVASYRQTVLTAFEGVEDELAALRVFQQQQEVLVQNEAAAREAVELDLAEYREGDGRLYDRDHRPSRCAQRIPKRADRSRRALPGQRAAGRRSGRRLDGGGPAQGLMRPHRDDLAARQARSRPPREPSRSAERNDPRDRAMRWKASLRSSHQSSGEGQGLGPTTPTISGSCAPG